MTAVSTATFPVPPIQQGEVGALPGTDVVYISGYGRSGSTILDMLLGSHPQMIGTGEVFRLFEGWQAGENCSCGQALTDCPFWTAVMARLRADMPGMEPSEADRLTRSVEGPTGAILPHPRIPEEARAQYGALWRSVLAGIAAEAGVRYVVDSSKSTRETGGRALALAALAGASVRVVHLVRDPRAVAWSLLRGSNRKLEAGEPARLAGGSARPLVGWVAANLRAAAAGRRLPTAMLRYEDLVRNPEAEIARLGRELHLDLSTVIEGIRSDDPIPGSHGVAGNRLRRSGRQRLHEDREWASALPYRARLLAAVTWPMARRYGYDVSRVRRRQEGDAT